MHKFLHTADDMQAWDLMLGTSFGFSSIGIPGAPPGLNPTLGALSESMDEKIQSKSNMDALAKYGVDMDHPCVRVYSQEEVDANRKFLVASGKRFLLHKLIRVRLYSLCFHRRSPNALACRDCRQGKTR